MSWVESHCWPEKKRRWSETAVVGVGKSGGGGGGSKRLVHFGLVPLLLDFQIFV